MEAFEQRPLIFDAGEVGRAGVFVTLDRDGGLAVYRGYVRPEDEPREETVANFGDELGAEGQGADDGVSAYQLPSGSSAATVITSGGQPVSSGLVDDEDDGVLKPMPERLVMELTAHRTLALREAIGRSPEVALTPLLMKLVNDTFRSSGASGSCLEASVRPVYMSAQAPDLKDSPVDKAVDDRHAAWEADLPLGNDAVLWNYLSVQGKETVQLLDHLKKGEMATEAERLLREGGWLPEVLRRIDLAALDGDIAAEGQGALSEEALDLADVVEEIDLPVENSPMMAAD